MWIIVPRKVNGKLTLTLGLRYDVETYPAAFVLKNDRNNFQPRFGFAYAMNSRTVLRGGFGLFNIGCSLVLGNCWLLLNGASMARAKNGNFDESSGVFTPHTAVWG